MDVINSLLTVEAGAGILMLGALAIIIRSFLFYSNQASELQPKLDKVNKELARLRESIAPKKKLVGELTTEVAPFRDKEQKFSDYCEQLREVELDEEKRQVANSEEEEAEQRRKVQRRRMGFGGDEDES